MKLSTNFYVYPSVYDIPTYEEIISYTQVYLKDFFDTQQKKNKTFKISVETYSLSDNKVIDLESGGELTQNEAIMAWFYVDGIAGGIEFYYFRIKNVDISPWSNEEVLYENYKKIKGLIKDNLKIGYYWSFKRTAGQHGLINLLYGLLAISLAKLTKGFLYSDDGAWDYSRFPIQPEEFINYYFKPDLIINPELKDFVEMSIRSIEKLDQ